MIVFLWAGGAGNGIGAIMGIVSFLTILLVPSIVNVLYLADDGEGERPVVFEHSTGNQETTSSLSFYSIFLLQVAIPIATIGTLGYVMANERVRRFFRLGSLNQGTAPNDSADPATTIAGKIRKLPLIEYKSGEDLRKMNLKDLVQYRKETKRKGYKQTYGTLTEAKTSLLESREEVIRDILGHEGDEEDVCSICFAQYESNDILRVLPCGHVFHADCGDLWFVRNQSCPLCKASL
jgi:hypothetical protein